MISNIANIEYMCSRCGVKQMRGPDNGKPEPGKCPKNNNNRHMWVVNRKIYKAGQDPAQTCSNVEYMCRHCGIKIVTGIMSGKPQPGMCPKRTKGLPHMWIVNRKW